MKDENAWHYDLHNLVDDAIIICCDWIIDFYRKKMLVSESVSGKRLAEFKWISSVKLRRSKTPIFIIAFLRICIEVEKYDLLMSHNTPMYLMSRDWWHIAVLIELFALLPLCLKLIYSISCNNWAMLMCIVGLRHFSG